MSEAIAVVNLDEFLDCEERGDRRHELVGGRLFAMAGGSERHDLAAGLFYEAVAAAARARGCRPFTANRLVRTAGGAVYYPDVVVVCRPAAHRLYEEGPVLVAEVLSRSTQEIDRREKAQAFAESSELAHFVLVDPDRRRIEVARPGPPPGGLRWTAYGPGDIVPIGFADIDVDAFYDTLDGTATTPPSP